MQQLLLATKEHSAANRKPRTVTTDVTDFADNKDRFPIRDICEIRGPIHQRTWVIRDAEGLPIAWISRIIVLDEAVNQLNPTKSDQIKPRSGQRLVVSSVRLLCGRVKPSQSQSNLLDEVQSSTFKVQSPVKPSQSQSNQFDSGLMKHDNYERDAYVRRDVAGRYHIF